MLKNQVNIYHMLTSLVFLLQGNVGESKKLKEIVKTEEEHLLFISSARLDKFNEIGINVTWVKSENTWSHSLSRKHIFGKTTGGGGSTWPQPFSMLIFFEVNYSKSL